MEVVNPASRRRITNHADLKMHYCYKRDFPKTVIDAASGCFVVVRGPGVSGWSRTHCQATSESTKAQQTFRASCCSLLDASRPNSSSERDTLKSGFKPLNYHRISMKEWVFEAVLPHSSLQNVPCRTHVFYSKQLKTTSGHVAAQAHRGRIFTSVAKAFRRRACRHLLTD